MARAFVCGCRGPVLANDERAFLRDADPLGVMDLTTHHAALADAPDLYRAFQRKEDGCIKVVLRPDAARSGLAL